MAIFKKFLSLLVVTGIAFALSVWTFGAFEFRSPMFACLINWLIMSWVAILGQLVTFPAFAPAYYEIKAFERSGKLYERLGVALFKKLVRRGPLAIFSPSMRFPTLKTLPALRTLQGEMRKAETAHVLIFSLVFLLVGYALFKGWLEAVAWLLLFDLLFNGYPVLLQRYNRLKIDELIERGMEDLQHKVP